MRSVFTLLLLTGLCCAPSVLADTIGVPWSEFKEIYKKHLTNTLRREKPELEEKQLYTIDCADYVLSLDNSIATCSLSLKGRVLKGKAEPIPILPSSVVLSAVTTVQGGSLLFPEKNGYFLALLPDEKGSFSIDLTFLLKVEEDKRSKFVHLPPTLAVKNGLRLLLPNNFQLLEKPGLPDEEGIFRFTLGQEKTVRFTTEASGPELSLIELDLCSHIRLQGKRVLMTTYFAPRRPITRAITIHPPKGAQLVSSSLKRSWLKRHEDGAISLHLPDKSTNTFWLQLSLTERTLSLPRVEDNDGKEGFLTVEEPEDGQVTVSAAGLVSPIPAARLNAALREALPGITEYKRLPARESLTLKVKHFATVKTPPIVLERVLFHSSFEENGSCLSLLSMKVPKTVGNRLKIGPVKAAEIWSLKVNGKRTKVYSAEDGGWVIPLAQTHASQVVLAFLRKGDKLGLRGRLEVIVPPINLPAQDTHLTIGLPRRVELVSIEGPIVAAHKNPTELPTQFVGTPYHFSRNFDKGEGTTVAVFYREPIDR